MSGLNTSTTSSSKDNWAKILAVISLIAGVAATYCSGFANYHAFSGMASDPATGQVWGIAGIASSFFSFSAFTIVWWKLKNSRRISDTWRAGLIGLLAASMGVMGSWMFMTNQHEAHNAELNKSDQDRQIITTQIERYQKELDELPIVIGSARLIREYLDEVKRVGKSDERYYRTRLEELAIAEQREELEKKRDAAEARLLTDPTFSAQHARIMIDPWLLAIIIEIFASQGTAMAVTVFLVIRENKISQAWLEAIEAESSDLDQHF